MEITEVVLRCVDRNPDRFSKVVAYATITFDNQFVVRDIKIVRSDTGFFVAMPCRKTTDHCPHCHGKNNLDSKFCSSCGVVLGKAPAEMKRHQDVAHPILPSCRRQIEESILAEYHKEIRIRPVAPELARAS